MPMPDPLVAVTAVAQYLEGLPRPWPYFVLLLPLIAVISVVHKATKLEGAGEILVQSLRLFASITAGMTAIAVALYLLVHFNT